jgi:hypothetical protein
MSGDKVNVTMTFKVSVPDTMTTEAYTKWCGQQCKDDPAGWIFSLQNLSERFPISVDAVKQPFNIADCGHTMFSDGYCGEMTCNNYYNKHRTD